MSNDGMIVPNHQICATTKMPQQLGELTRGRLAGHRVASLPYAISRFRLLPRRVLAFSMLPNSDRIVEGHVDAQHTSIGVKRAYVEN